MDVPKTTTMAPITTSGNVTAPQKAASQGPIVARFLS
jgi:hypothetical protein